MNTGDDVTEAHYNMPTKFITDEKLREIWGSVVYLRGKGHPIDLVTIATRLQSKGLIGDGSHQIQPEYIAEVMNDVPLSTNINTYYNIIFEAYKLKRLKGATSTSDAEKLLELSKKYEIKDSD
ncbi:unnamed protein product, partial [marine sediment metagenome]